MIPLSSPDISELEIEAVVEVLRSGRLSLGPKLAEFEAAMAEYIGVPHCVALSSGTAGLHLGLQALGISEGDEVILPSFTFIAAANSVLFQRATPVFVEIDPKTLNLDPDAVSKAISPRTRAILAVHTFGYPADLDPVLTLAKQHHLFVIEDACEAIGAEYHGRKAGTFGHFSVFSFYPNKPITTGEGGVLLTSDPQLAITVRALRNQGRMETDGWLEHSILGYNYRLSEINCALGIEQLKRIEFILARRETVADLYYTELCGNPNVILPERTIQNGRVSWFAFVIRLTPEFTREDRDDVLNRLTLQGIGNRPYFPPIHRQPLYAKFNANLRITEQTADRTIALPFFNALTHSQVREVCTALTEAIQACRKT